VGDTPELVGRLDFPGPAETICMGRGTSELTGGRMDALRQSVACIVVKTGHDPSTDFAGVRMAFPGVLRAKIKCVVFIRSNSREREVRDGHRWEDAVSDLVVRPTNVNTVPRFFWN
jgi:hypothetical protein